MLTVRAPPVHHSPHVFHKVGAYEQHRQAASSIGVAEGVPRRDALRRGVGLGDGAERCRGAPGDGQPQA